MVNFNQYNINRLEAKLARANPFNGFSGLVDDGPFPDDPQPLPHSPPCTCIQITVIRASVTCKRCPVFDRVLDDRGRLRNKADELYGRPIKSYSLIAKVGQQARCDWEPDPDVPEPGDTYTSVMVDRGSEESCKWRTTILVVKNLGDCDDDCCGKTNTEVTETKHLNHVRDINCDNLWPDRGFVNDETILDGTWGDWTRGVEDLMRKLMKELVYTGPKPLGCCPDVFVPIGAPPSNTIGDSLPIEDMMESFLLAWDGKNSMIKGNKMGEDITPKSKNLPKASVHPSGGEFKLYDESGTTYQHYYENDIVTYRGRRYRVTKDVSGSHPTTSNSFKLIRTSNTDPLDGGSF